jgi:hypothetical protein
VWGRAGWAGDCDAAAVCDRQPLCVVAPAAVVHCTRCQPGGRHVRAARRRCEVWRAGSAGPAPGALSACEWDALSDAHEGLAGCWRGRARRHAQRRSWWGAPLPTREQKQTARARPWAVAGGAARAQRCRPRAARRGGLVDVRHSAAAGHATRCTPAPTGHAGGRRDAGTPRAAAPGGVHGAPAAVRLPCVGRCDVRATLVAGGRAAHGTAEQQGGCVSTCNVDYSMVLHRRQGRVPMPRYHQPERVALLRRASFRSPARI